MPLALYFYRLACQGLDLELAADELPARALARAPGLSDPECLELAALCQPHRRRVRCAEDVGRLVQRDDPALFVKGLPRGLLAHRSTLSPSIS